MPYDRDMSPTRAPGGDSSGGSPGPGAFQLEISLQDLPMDIQPPSPKQSKKQRFSHTPFLYTQVAKKAFEETQSSNRPPRPGSADPFANTSPGLLGDGHGKRTPVLI